MSNSHWQTNSNLIERIIIKGNLKLLSPASLSDGTRDGLTDISLLLDPITNQPLLTGTSIAGALRSYLRTYEFGYGKEDAKDSLYAHLFGGIRPEDTGVDRRKNFGQNSPLIIDDAISSTPLKMEIRDGVRLNSKTRTAEDQAKFDTTLLSAGTVFPLEFELQVTKDDKAIKLKNGLVIALQGFENADIAIGGRKKRGLGQCQVETWQLWRYSMQDTDGLIGWLENSGQPMTGKIADLLSDAMPNDTHDQRKQFTLKAIFSLDTSLLIRSGSGESNSPDTVHLHSHRNGKDVPIVSGTSLTGALRARAERIANTINLPKEFVEDMFGSTMDKQTETPTASRVIVHECEIHNGITKLVQSRVKIDRFTGGSYPTALFNQQPVFGRADGKTCLTIKIALRQGDEKKFKAEIRLLLLLLKDLWTGDLPLGGEASVGRGRLKGIEATMTFNEEVFKLNQTESNGLMGDKAELEKFVGALQKEVIHA